MALTASYDTTLSRIRLQLTGATVTPSYAVFDRTVDGITYSTVRGGLHVDSATGAAGPIDDYEFPAGVLITYRCRTYNPSNVLLATATTTITQDLPGIWLKVPAAPFMNRPITVSTVSALQRAARRQLFDIIGRSTPVAVAGIRSSVSYDLVIRTSTPDEEETLDLILGSGEVLFLHLPFGETCMRGGYYSAGDVSWAPPGSKARPERLFTIPLTEVAAPSSDVVGSSYTWQSAINDYATWTALLAANATWADLLQRVGSPSDTVVG